jgi:hypothetical protein
VTGKRFVDVTGALVVTTGTLTSVAHAAAGVRALGISSRDAASGANVGVELRGILPVTCGAAITAGSEVEVGTGGKAIPLASGKSVGKAVSTTTAADTDVFVRFH